MVSSIATVGNYEYGFFWHFCQDGTIEHQVKLTGNVSTGAAVPLGPDNPHGTPGRLDRDCWRVRPRPSGTSTRSPGGTGSS